METDAPHDRVHRVTRLLAWAAACAGLLIGSLAFAYLLLVNVLFSGRGGPVFPFESVRNASDSIRLLAEVGLLAPSLISLVSLYRTGTVSPAVVRVAVALSLLAGLASLVLLATTPWYHRTSSLPFALVRDARPLMAPVICCAMWVTLLFALRRAGPISEGSQPPTQ